MVLQYQPKNHSKQHDGSKDIKLGKLSNLIG